jgi:hypothetical protein
MFSMQKKHKMEKKLNQEKSSIIYIVLWLRPQKTDLKCNKSRNLQPRRIDRFRLGSEPPGPNAPRPYGQALCAPYHIKVALQLY